MSDSHSQTGLMCGLAGELMALPCYLKSGFYILLIPFGNRGAKDENSMSLKIEIYSSHSDWVTPNRAL